MARYTLTLSPNYVKDWTDTEAVRELLQNAIDQETIDPNNIKSIEVSEDTLIIGNLTSKLEKSTLLLGGGTKDGTNTIGQFGEGYKVALLVLLRDGYKIEIKNYGLGELWIPRIVNSRVYESEVLAIDTMNYDFEGVPRNNLEIVISKEEVDFDEILKSVWLEKQEYKVLHTDTEATILENQAGNIYINGLFVSNIPKYKYGYDFRPNIIKVGRDRNIVGGYDLEATLGKVWGRVENYELVESLISSKVPDVAWVSDWKMSTGLKNYIKEKYKNQKVVHSQQDSENIKKLYGNIPTVIVPDNIRDVVYDGEEYQEITEIKYKSVATLLEEFMEQFEDELTEEMITELEFIKRRA